jgi:(1->4)-alpha-D-glucan 1-alpha-D-glucosylmutase
MKRVVTATYRLQLTRSFPVARARELVPYFERLGVSHLYLSPVLAARTGSQHGYDVVDHARINPELGTEDDLRALADDLHARGMGILLDIVPNHMAASAENPYWDNVLERGRSSRYADWFDIEWDAPRAQGKVVLPVLGDELDVAIARRELALHIRDSGARIRYFDATFPLDPSTLPRELQLAQLTPEAREAADAWASGPDGRKRMRALLDRQNYRLAFWRKARTDINYRRFFDVNDLVALRMDTDAVFDATHALILRLVKDRVIDGLRVDHVDGLRDPAWYLAKLRASVNGVRGATTPDAFPILVEKILTGDEELPPGWPVSGTTGYDFMNEVEEIFLDPSGFSLIEAHYRGLRHSPDLDFRAVALDGKRRALRGALWSDVLRLARHAHAWNADVEVETAAGAIVEVIAHLEPYRTYVVEPGVMSDADRMYLTRAFREARASGEADIRAIALLERAFLSHPVPHDHARAELVARFQQTSGPAAAKGVEDTALYVYLPLASRNEVGAKPDRKLDDAPQRLHARNLRRATHWPAAMLASNTHDTKRSADLRSRLDVLTADPGVWARYVGRWRRLNRAKKRVVAGKPSPDTNSEYLYYQTLLGLWPSPRRDRRADDLPSRDWLDRTRERLVTYMAKAAKEAKTRTSWVERDEEFEKALDSFVRASMVAGEDEHFLPDVARLTAQTADAGFRFALARLLLHCTSPGVPDLYQGDELWNFTLVDPDNRLAVDFARRLRLLEEGEPREVLSAAFDHDAELEDRVKLALVRLLLRFRREHSELMLHGEYLPLAPGDPVASSAPSGIFAFARRTASEVCIAVARTRSHAGGMADGVHQLVTLPGDLAGRWRSTLTGRVVDLVRADSHVTIDVALLVPLSQPCELLVRENR